MAGSVFFVKVTLTETGISVSLSISRQTTTSPSDSATVLFTPTNCTTGETERGREREKHQVRSWNLSSYGWLNINEINSSMLIGVLNLRGYVYTVIVQYCDFSVIDTAKFYIWLCWIKLDIQFEMLWILMYRVIDDYVQFSTYSTGRCRDRYSNWDTYEILTLCGIKQVQTELVWVTDILYQWLKEGWFLLGWERGRWGEWSSCPWSDTQLVPLHLLLVHRPQLQTQQAPLKNRERVWNFDTNTERRFKICKLFQRVLTVIIFNVSTNSLSVQGYSILIWHW